MRITASMRFAPFLLLHCRHSLVVYLTARLLLTFGMAFSRQPLFGVEYVALMPLLTMALMYADRRRTGGWDLYANLGWGARELLSVGALLAVIAEIAISACAVVYA